MPFNVPKYSRFAPFKSFKVLNPASLSDFATFDEKLSLINNLRYDSKRLLSKYEL